MKKLGVITILVLVILIGGFAYWLNKDNTVSVNKETKTTLSPTQIKSVEAIGQWEFLSISDEELVDTVRHGFFGDDELVRIYYGTLRLGINIKDAKQDWLQADHDTIVCTLPPIKLLDNNFIDEAKTRSFFESGKWTGNDRQDMYNRAYAAMKKRCMSPTNLSTARSNAQSQFFNMFKTMGYSNVKVQFEEESNQQ